MVIRKYDEILNDFLEKFKEIGDVRESSPLYIMASASALLFADMYEEINYYLESTTLSGCTGEFLDAVARIQGIERLPATKAVVKIEGGSNLMVGDHVTGGELEFVVTSNDNGICYAQCTIEGEDGNNYTGEVICPTRSDITDTIKIACVVARGQGVETDDELRKRFIEIINCPVCTGNVTYYKSIADSVTGVGGRKIVPSEEYGGSVRVIITDPDYSVADEELVRFVENQLDPEGYKGMGMGLVPVGHKVLVESVKKVNVNIVLEVKNKLGNDVTEAYCRYARSYMGSIFEQMNSKWDSVENIIIRDRIIEDFLMEYGAYDVNVISINDQPNRLILAENEIIGEVTFNGA